MAVTKQLKSLYIKLSGKLPLKFDYLFELEKTLKNCNSILDVGCGSNSPLRNISKVDYCVGVDIFEPWINKSEKDKIHDKYYKLDVLKLDSVFTEKSFDCVVALDLLEHLTKEEGNKLLKSVEKLAKKKVIIFTTNGYVPQQESDNNPWNVHKSGWTTNEMKQRGYRVFGMNGLKILLRGYASLKFRPQFIWYVVARLSQILVRNHPKRAFQILCIKEIKV